MSSPGSNKEEKQAGSPDRGEPAFLVVGRIGRPHGVRGEVSFRTLTDFPERLVAGKRVYVGPGHTEMTIVNRRGSRDRMILSLDGVTDRDAAALLRNQMVHVRAAEIPALPEGEFYIHQLIGLEVHAEGAALGKVTEVISTGANDVLVVRTESGDERLLPAIDDVLLDVDLENGRIQAALLPGL